MFREVEVTEQEEQAPVIPYRPQLPRRGDTFDDDLKAVWDMVHDAYQPDPHLKMAIYGQPGVGKTWLAASFPDSLIIDCHEQGSKFLPKERFQSVDVINTTNLKQVEMVYYGLRGGKQPYKTVVIDTVTSLIEMAVKYQRTEDDDSLSISKTPPTSTWGLWNSVNANVGDLLWFLLELPMNVILLAHERERKDDDSIVDMDEEYLAPRVFPDVNPGIRKKLYGSVDIMGRMVLRELTFKSKDPEKATVKRLARLLYVRPSPNFQAKDRTDVFSKTPYIVDPTYEKLERQLRRLDKEVS